MIPWIITWWVVGLLTYIIALFVIWYSGDDIDLEILIKGFGLSFFGPILTVLAIMVLSSFIFEKYQCKVIFKGHEKTSNEDKKRLNAAKNN